MIDNLASDGAVQRALFAEYADPPWLLHLSGELDLCSAPALTAALEDRPSAAAPSALISPS
jgi:hypothetical protein